MPRKGLLTLKHYRQDRHRQFLQAIRWYYRDVGLNREAERPNHQDYGLDLWEGNQLWAKAEQERAEKAGQTVTTGNQ